MSKSSTKRAPKDIDFVLAEQAYLFKRSEVTQCFDTGKQKICTSLDRRECRHTRYLLADRPFRHGEIECAVLVADERVPFVAQFVKIRVIDPDILRKLKLPHEACTQNE